METPGPSVFQAGLTSFPQGLGESCGRRNAGRGGRRRRISLGQRLYAFLPSRVSVLAANVRILIATLDVVVARFRRSLRDDPDV